MTVCEIGIIVLNYNDYNTTILLIDNLLKDKYFVDNTKIVIVDNKSTNNSYEILSDRYKDKIDVIQSQKNGGYAYGNNFGVKYLKEKYDIKYCAICNPDVEITSDTFSEMIKYLKHNNHNVKVVGCKAYEGNGEVARYCWKLPSVAFEIMSSLVLINRLFVRKRIYYTQEQLGKKHLLVDVILGAFFVFDVEAFIEVGMLDEITFLYCEEQMLSIRLKKHGYRLAVLNHQTYIHNHVYTNNISKKIRDYSNHQKSKRLYIENYKKCNKITLMFFDLITVIGIFERKVCAKLMRR